MPFGLQPWHLIVVLVVALIIFGPSKLPKLGRSLGTFFRDLRAGARDMSNGFKASLEDPETPKSPGTQPTQAGDQENGVQKAGGTPGASDAKTGNDKPAAPAPGNFCTSCGAPNPPLATFCNACGKKIRD
jgi:sec-independent protein translocase protein TatA